MTTQVQKHKIGRLSYFYKEKNVTTVIAWLLIVAILNLSSCSYYTSRNVPTTGENISKTVKEFNQTEKYVIIHYNDLSWHLDNMIINENGQTISGTVLPINPQHQYKRIRESKRVHRYNIKKTKPLDEIHFYLKTPTNFEVNTSVSIPLSDIASVSVNDKNTGRAIANVILGTVGTLFVTLLLYAALKSSCPFIYIKNGENYDFVGELYPGIITANMQKDDYLPLSKFKPDNGVYSLKIANQLKEIQYTNHVQLVLVNHEKDVEVLLDREGVLQTFSKIIPPINATLDNQIIDIATALKKDNNFYAFNTSIESENNTRNVIFEFDKPYQKGDAKLYLTAKNSVWLDYIFGKFNEQFGSYYKTFQKQQQQVDADKIKEWSQGQHIPLSVYIKTIAGWQLVDRINTVGPMAMRDIVVPLKLDNVFGDKVQVKLETGFMFWEVDYVGIDFTKNIDLELEYINPSKAVDQYGNDVTDLLDKTDEKYFAQPNIGDEVLVNFPINELKGELNHSVFLKNSGYYNYIRDYKGMPDFEKLKSFKENGAFTNFSEEAYFDFVNNINSNQLAYYE